MVRQISQILSILCLVEFLIDEWRIKLKFDWMGDIKNMETWYLTDELRKKFKPIIEDYIRLLESDKVDDVNKKYVTLTNQGISPVQVRELLEELGYEQIDYDSNG